MKVQGGDTHLTLRKLRQEDPEYEASLGHIVISLSQHTNIGKEKKKRQKKGRKGKKERKGKKLIYWPLLLYSSTTVNKKICKRGTEGS
jgi:hypothetical protein